MGLSNVYGAAIILAAAQIIPSAKDPLAPARSGQLQCYSPDTSRKVCNALARYTWTAKQEIQNVAEVLISQNPPIAMRTTSPVSIRSGAVCGPIRLQDLNAAEILVAGLPAAPQVTEQVRPQLSSLFARIIGREVCTAYVRDKTGYITKVTIDGAAHPELSEKVIWVAPNDGYSVGP